MKKTTQWPTLAVGCGLLGILMACREELGSIWQRALMASVAGGLLGMLCVWVRRPAE